MPMVSSLHVDIEGGFGGSSRSLFELVSRLDRTLVRPTVVCRTAGPAAAWYGGIDVPVIVVPQIFSFVARDTAPYRNLLATLPRFSGIGPAAVRLHEIAKQTNCTVIHFNHEGLALIARRLSNSLRLPAVGHSRAMIGDNYLGRLMARQFARAIDHIFCISPQELQRWRQLTDGCGYAPHSEVLWNIGRAANERKAPSGTPQAVYLGNIDASKGTDRLVDVAAALERRRAPPLKIAVYGQARNAATFTRQIIDRINSENLSARIEIMGHTTDVPSVLASAVALLRPSRYRDPWGRDLIEAAIAGVPAIASGTFDGVVKSGVTGWLVGDFDPDVVAGLLCDLLAQPALFDQMCRAARAHGLEQFSGRRQAVRFTEVLSDLGSRAVRP